MHTLRSCRWTCSATAWSHLTACCFVMPRWTSPPPTRWWCLWAVPHVHPKVQEMTVREYFNGKEAAQQLCQPRRELWRTVLLCRYCQYLCSMVFALLHHILRQANIFQDSKSFSFLFSFTYFESFKAFTWQAQLNHSSTQEQRKAQEVCPVEFYQMQHQG